MTELRREMEFLGEAIVFCLITNLEFRKNPTELPQAIKETMQMLSLGGFKFSLVYQQEEFKISEVYLSIEYDNIFMDFTSGVQDYVVWVGFGW